MISVTDGADDSGFPPRPPGWVKPADDPELESAAYSEWATRNAVQVWSELD